MRLNIEDYGKRICATICRHHAYASKQKNTEQAYTEMFYNKCAKNCPLEGMLQCLREERDQNMEIVYEVIED